MHSYYYYYYYYSRCFFASSSSSSVLKTHSLINYNTHKQTHINTQIHTQTYSKRKAINARSNHYFHEDGKDVRTKKLTLSSLCAYTECWWWVFCCNTDRFGFRSLYVYENGPFSVWYVILWTATLSINKQNIPIYNNASSNFESFRPFGEISMPQRKFIKVSMNSWTGCRQ